MCSQCQQEARHPSDQKPSSAPSRPATGWAETRVSAVSTQTSVQSGSPQRSTTVQSHSVSPRKDASWQSAACPGPPPEQSESPSPSSGTTRSTEPPRTTNRFFRLAGRRPRMARPADRADAERPGRDPRRDLADRRFLRQPLAVLLRPAFRRGQGERGGVPGQGHDLLGAAVRHRRVHERRDRRDQVADRLHGRLPDDDEQGHVHHQRHRARRRSSSSVRPASTSTRTWTRPPARTSSRSRSSRRVVPGSSSTSTSATPSVCGSTASAASRSPCC